MKRSLLLLLALVAFAAGDTPPPWEKPLKTGQNLYRENCVVCHDIDKAESKKFGPSLFRFFQRDDLPQVGPQREQYLRIRVQFGGEIMPAFRERITAPQLDLLVDYIRSRDK